LKASVLSVSSRIAHALLSIARPHPVACHGKARQHASA
jgi:hypothetical protein